MRTEYMHKMCCNYFEPFRGIKRNPNLKKIALCALKILSYLTIAIPIAVAMARKILHTRVSKIYGIDIEKIKNKPASLFTGPLGGIYNREFLNALSAGQPMELTEYDFNARADADEWNQVRDNYNAFLNRMDNKTLVDIPIEKTIHLIWIGPKPVPNDVLQVRKSWEKHHSQADGWTVKLWGNQEVENIIAKKRGQYPSVGSAWDAADKWAEKADIARYCILEEEGGLYTDTDLPCYGKVDELHAYSDFYVGLEQNDHPDDLLYVCNALIGARKGHPIIADCLKNLKPRQRFEANWAIIGRTGPGLVTDQIYKHLREDIANQTHRTLVMPPAYFYPLPFGSREMAKNVPGYGEKQVLPYSKGLHLWNLSWG